MSSVKAAVAITLCVGALAACSKKTETAAAGGGTGASAPAAGPATPPSRKAGLWEQTMTLPQMAQSARSMTQTTKICLDETTEAKMKWWATENRRGGPNCAEQSFTPKLGGWSFHSVCDMGDGGKVVSDGQAIGDFGSHYKVDVTSVTTGSAMAETNGTHKITIDATWKGPCPAGMKPGDIEMPGGMRINMVDATSGAGPTINGVKPGQVPSHAEIAKMRAQAMAMEKAMKDGGK